MFSNVKVGDKIKVQVNEVEVLREVRLKSRNSITIGEDKFLVSTGAYYRGHGELAGASLVGPHK